MCIVYVEKIKKICNHHQYFKDCEPSLDFNLLLKKLSKEREKLTYLNKENLDDDANYF